jgi:DNA modification methylase
MAADWLHHGDCREILPALDAGSVHTCVTSPPYFGLRKYGEGPEIGAEPTPAEYVAALVNVFREVRRVLRDDGTVWLVLGDSYAGSWGAQGRQGKTGALAGRSAVAARQIACARKQETLTGSLARTPGLKPKDLIGIPWRVAFALQADGWYLRQDIIWHKPNPMPESVRDRCTKAHEYVFLLSKSARYSFDAEAIKEPCQTDPKENYPGRARITGRGDQKFAAVRGNDRGKSGGFPISGDKRNRRSVWTVATQAYSGAHFATYPVKLIEPCILAGAPVGGLVLDPFAGTGTTALAALKHGRRFIGCELYAANVALARERLLASGARQDRQDCTDDARYGG